LHRKKIVLVSRKLFPFYKANMSPFRVNSGKVEYNAIYYLQIFVRRILLPYNENVTISDAYLRANIIIKGRNFGGFEKKPPN